MGVPWICPSRPPTNPQRERADRKLDRDLAIDDRVSNVQRIKRIDEFIRLQTLAKIQEEDARSSRLVAEKAAIVSQMLLSNDHQQVHRFRFVCVALLLRTC